MNALFSVFALNEAGKAKAQFISDQFNYLLGRLTHVCPSGRELDIVKTKLEEAFFYANRAVATDVLDREDS